MSEPQTPTPPATARERSQEPEAPRGSGTAGDAMARRAQYIAATWEQTAAATVLFLATVRGEVTLNDAHGHGAPLPPPGASWARVFARLEDEGTLHRVDATGTRYERAGGPRARLWDQIAGFSTAARERVLNQGPQNLAGTPFADLSQAANALAAALVADCEDAAATAEHIARALNMHLAADAAVARSLFLAQVLDVLLAQYVVPMYGYYRGNWEKARPGVSLREDLLTRAGWSVSDG